MKIYKPKSKRVKLFAYDKRNHILYVRFISSPEVVYAYQSVTEDDADEIVTEHEKALKSKERASVFDMIKILILNHTNLHPSTIILASEFDKMLTNPSHKAIAVIEAPVFDARW